MANSRLQNLSMLKSNIAYAVGSIARSAALFVLIPYLVNTLTVEEYGAWSLIEIMILILTTFIIAGITTGLMQKHWAVDQPEEQRKLAGTTFLAVMTWGALLITGLGIFVAITGWDWSMPGSKTTMILILLISYFESLFDVALTILRIREKAVRFVFISLGKMFLFMGFSIALVQLGGGLVGALTGRLISGVLGVAISLLICWKYIRWRFESDSFRNMTSYGLPLLPTNIASYVLFASDRFFLKSYTSLEAVAIYTFAYKIATTIDILVIRPFSIDWAPRRFKIARSTNSKIQYNRILIYFLWASTGFSLLVLAGTQLIYRLFSPALYFTGIGLIPIILLAYFIYGLSYPLNIGIMLENRTGYLPVIGWLSAAACIILNIFLIKQYNMYGAAWATVISYTIWTSLIALLSQRLYRVAYSINQISWTVVPGIIGFLSIILINYLLPASAWLGGLALSLLVAAISIGISGYKILRTPLSDWQSNKSLPISGDIN